VDEQGALGCLPIPSKLRRWMRLKIVDEWKTPGWLWQARDWLLTLSKQRLRMSRRIQTAYLP
jgi:hypothetical protein